MRKERTENRRGVRAASTAARVRRARRQEQEKQEQKKKMEQHMQVLQHGQVVHMLAGSRRRGGRRERSTTMSGVRAGEAIGRQGAHGTCRGGMVGDSSKVADADGRTARCSARRKVVSLAACYFTASYLIGLLLDRILTQTSGMTEARGARSRRGAADKDETAERRAEAAGQAARSSQEASRAPMRRGSERSRGVKGSCEYVEHGGMHLECARACGSPQGRGRSKKTKKRTRAQGARRKGAWRPGGAGQTVRVNGDGTAARKARE